MMLMMWGCWGIRYADTDTDETKDGDDSGGNGDDTSYVYVS